MLREKATRHPRVFDCYLLCTVLLTICAGPSCHNASGTATEESDTFDSDSEVDAGSEQEYPEMECGDGHLYNYGIVSYVVNSETYVGWFQRALYEYEYDELKRPIAATMHEYSEDSKLLAYFERTYTYNSIGNIERMDWTTHYYDEYNEDVSQARVFTYDEQGRLLKDDLWIGSGEDPMELVWGDLREYGESGQVVAYYWGGDFTGNYHFGKKYEYYDDGKLKKSILLDAWNKWTEIGTFTEYYYDSLGRISREFRREQDYQQGKPVLVDTEINFYYQGDTGLLTESVNDNGERITYEWNEFTLTVTNIYPNRLDDQWVYSFSSEGSSYYLETFPMPPENWADYYGSGYINGCI